MQEGKEKISDLLQQQLRAILQFEEENNTKLIKVMNTLGKNSSRYWSVIKDKGTQSINTLKDRHGKLATTKQETLNAAFNYFQSLFKTKVDNNPAETVQTSSWVGWYPK